MKKVSNLTHQTFGKLHVIEDAGVKYFPSGQKQKLWKCRCDCGNEKVILGASLKSGNTTSCGCAQKENTSLARRSDLTGQKFGLLKAIEFSHTDEHGQSYWQCLCECGGTNVVNTANLKGGRSKSCGCKQGRFIHGMWGKPGYKSHYLKDPVKKVRHAVSVAVRNALAAVGLTKGQSKTFEHLPYTPQQLKEHLESQFEDWMSWDNYGGSNGNVEKTWHIDHIKPQAHFPYTSLDDVLFQECWALVNLRPLEKIENMSKRCSIRA